ncbi:hypothetical protein TEA_008575 [Camellia sinensis var. sinensis]|uniref:Mitochondrial import inner membrane translocase subunit Tim21 n=1 Tax=Camellia sinensis var. sinensis TaxID=542762 RepID=A0A4S4EJU3_CAMSN|nr:hypothetical protein TEA_008575 [Camellia sinensis var. sinensis]
MWRTMFPFPFQQESFNLLTILPQKRDSALLTQIRRRIASLMLEKRESGRGSVFFSSSRSVCPSSLDLMTRYGQESRNRAARQRIPNRIWTDEDGVEHVEVNFHIRGPRGAGNVYTEMFRDKVDKQWKFTYLIVEIKSPSPAKLMLESYVPA